MNPHFCKFCIVWSDCLLFCCYLSIRVHPRITALAVFDWIRLYDWWCIGYWLFVMELPHPRTRWMDTNIIWMMMLYGMSITQWPRTHNLYGNAYMMIGRMDIESVSWEMPHGMATMSGSWIVCEWNVIANVHMNGTHGLSESRTLSIITYVGSGQCLLVT